MYSDGESERLVGKAIKKLAIPREEIVILTKTYMNLQLPGTKQGTIKNPDAEGCGES